MTTKTEVIDILTRRVWGQASYTDMLRAVNNALSEIGDSTQIDETLTVVDDQKEYTLPSGVTNVVRVEITDSGSTNYNMVRIYNWREIDGELHFPKELGYTAGRTIKLYYNPEHDPDSTSFDDGIPTAMVMAYATYYYYLKEYADGDVRDEHIAKLLEIALADKQKADMKYKVKRMNRDPILRK